jgi:regulator of protease activity HflC (stomatin/prohibitin superfamily)
MAEIKTFPLIRHLRAEPTAHVLRYRHGRLATAGPGLAFWFAPNSTAIAEIPLGNQELPFVFHARSADFQQLIVQGVITFRFGDPELVARRVDFTLDLSSGRWTETPLEQVHGLLVQMAQQYVIDELLALELRTILAEGVAPIRERIISGLAAEQTLADLGVEIVAVRVAQLSPEGDVQKALAQPTREAIQQQADQATFARRALAVEKERAIAENELQNRIELARREQQLVTQHGANERRRAEEEAAAKAIAATSTDQTERMGARRRADAVKELEAVRLEAERRRAEIQTSLGAQILLALAARELAGQLGKVEHLTVTPELLTPLLGRLNAAPTVPSANEEA